MRGEDRALLARLYAEAVGAAAPAAALAPHLPAPPAGRTVVVGAGKGAAQLARAFEGLWPGPVEGVVVTRHGHGCPTRRIRVLEAGHPVPDAAGLAASAALLAAVAGLGPDDLVVALIAGGGSALLPAPPAPLGLADEQALNRALLASGAPIGVMNRIRRQVSTIKGGRLALAARPARLLTLVVSDVPGDDAAEVASGPTVPSAGSPAEALALARAWGVALPPAVAAFLAAGGAPAPDPGDADFAAGEVRVIASAGRSLEAAAAAARGAGLVPAILSDAVEGEAREVARVHAAILREVVLRNRPFARPVAILSGGETTVTLRGEGRGGRNGEFALALALAAAGLPFAALAADTDGIDGSETNAGAFADGGTLARLRARGLDPSALLAANNSWAAFAALGDLFEPGPTGTNVNDFRAILVR
ncbi:MAG: glycerate kinase [Rhodobacteraceae bacterium]|nr:glycerate kinase [Paracoccaceae bacterium]